MANSTTANRSAPRRIVRRAWNDLLSIYYANTPIWRWFKSGGLLVFGFFCWSAASLLLSYRPDWTFLHYVMAYGFALIVWGPLTHFVIVPLAIRLRRTAEHPAARFFARNVSKINLSVFVVIVIVLAVVQFSPMMLDFGGAFESDSGSEVTADLECEQTDDLITCQLTSTEGVDRIEVTSGDREVAIVDDPGGPFEIRVDALEEVVGQKQYSVALYDEDGNRVGVFRRSAR
ncbi:hypothetical protein [Halovivax gelatinilyticus]|uniref:hypothetical protein n=1 Tax=Halovivax gelatinilyticus TaxID=2961597 RepID=UPI0020CA5E80|nr:hypothetical protein [Halovivax gelatinilyticus]